MSEILSWSSELTVPLTKNRTHKLRFSSLEDPEKIFAFFRKELKQSWMTPSNFSGKRRQKTYEPEALVTELMESFCASSLYKPERLVGEVGRAVIARATVMSAWTLQSPVEFAYNSEALKALERPTVLRESNLKRASIRSVHPWGFRVHLAAGVRSYKWANLQEAHFSYGVAYEEREMGLILNFSCGKSSNEPGSVELTVTKETRRWNR